MVPCSFYLSMYPLLSLHKGVHVCSAMDSFLAGDSGVVVVSSEVRPEQGRVHALPQGPLDTAAHSRHVGRQREGGKHGGMAQSK